jgi:hypothetical protein
MPRESDKTTTTPVSDWWDYEDGPLQRSVTGAPSNKPHVSWFATAKLICDLLQEAWLAIAT